MARPHRLTAGATARPHRLTAGAVSRPHRLTAGATARPHRLTAGATARPRRLLHQTVPVISQSVVRSANGLHVQDTKCETNLTDFTVTLFPTDGSQ